MEGLYARELETNTIEKIFDDSYQLISFEDSLTLSDCNHVAHCCIYSPHSFQTVNSQESKAHISVILIIINYNKMGYYY